MLDIRNIPFIRKLDDWLHDPNSSFNKGSTVKPYRELLNPEHPDWLIKGRKFGKGSGRK